MVTVLTVVLLTSFGDGVAVTTVVVTVALAETVPVPVAVHGAVVVEPAWT